MKQFLALLVFLLATLTFVSAQGNGGGNGNGNGGNGNNGNSVWANANWPQYIIKWLEDGGQIPMPLAVVVIHDVRSWGQQNFNLNQGQMLVKYLQGQLTIEYLSTAPPSLTFRVSFGGIGIITDIDQF